MFTQLRLGIGAAMLVSLVACSSAPKTGENPDMDMSPTVGQDESGVDYEERARLELEKANRGEVNEVEIIGTSPDGTTIVSEAIEGQDLGAMEGSMPAMGQTFEPVIYFGYDQFMLDDGSLATVQHYATILVDNPDEKIQLIGHTDERGTPEYNLALGERRAKAVAEAFMLFGVSDNRIEIVSMGEEEPAVAEQNEAAWAKNRRVEIKAQ